MSCPNRVSWRSSTNSRAPHRGQSTLSLRPIGHRILIAKLIMARSQSEVEYCILNVQQGLRLDGRANTDLRPISIQLGPIAQANGSARLRIGDTDVIVGVKVSTCQQSWSQPKNLHARPLFSRTRCCRCACCSCFVFQAEVGSVSKAHPNCGRLLVTVEASPCASPEYEVQQGNSIHVTKGLHRLNQCNTDRRKGMPTVVWALK